MSKPFLWFDKTHNKKKREREKEEEEEEKNFM
jgi:hypothetical protein